MNFMEVDLKIEEGYLIVSVSPQDEEGKAIWIALGYLPLTELKEALDKLDKKD